MSDNPADDAKVVCKIISYDPVTLQFPLGNGPFIGVIAFELPDMRVKAFDLSMDGIIPGSPGIYADMPGYRYQLDAIKEVDAAKLTELVFFLKDNFVKLSSSVQDAVQSVYSRKA